ncbi:MAG: hypothetical protein J0L92_21090 [Deltaproteobacteria bacterium]|nr:hypothetical protein [Deltaproteobacteria bacterium]
MRFSSDSLFVSSCVVAFGLWVAGCPGRQISELGGPCERPGRGSLVGCRTGLTCAYGVCRTDCDTSRDCLVGRRCIAGDGGDDVCSLEAEDTCRAESDCAGGLSCERGECRTTCEDASDCVGDSCTSGTCTEPVSTAMPDGSACTDDLGCFSGSICTYGRCRPSCESGCPVGRRCLAEMGEYGCSLPDEEECTSTDDCTDGLTCFSDECRTQCEDDSDCSPPDGRCAEGLCNERMQNGRVDAGPRADAGRVEVPDAHIVGYDAGPRGAQTRLANAFTLSPSLSQTVRVLGAWTSAPMPARDLVAGSRLAPIGVTLTGRSDADGRGVGYVGTVDGNGVARIFRFPGDAPSEATDRSSDLASATNLIDLALMEDGAVVRGLAIRARTEDAPVTQAGWTWTEGSAPASYDRTLGVGGHGVYTFGQAAITGGSRTVGPDQDLRYLVRERERLATGIDPVRYEAGDPFLTALDVGARVASSDPTSSLFTSDVLAIRALPDFALIWDPETEGSTMMRLREEGAMLRTSYERLGFLDTSSAPPVIAQQHLVRTEAMVAVPNGPSTTLHTISCPEPSACTSEAMVFLPTPGGSAATTLAAAPLRGGYALVTVDAAGIILRALTRELEVVPGYDDGGMLDSLGPSTMTLADGSYSLMDLDAYAFAVEDTGGALRSVTLLVAGLFANFTTMDVRLWVTGVRVEVP